jgi:hypothetical protein
MVHSLLWLESQTLPPRPRFPTLSRIGRSRPFKLVPEDGGLGGLVDVIDTHLCWVGKIVHAVVVMPVLFSFLLLSTNASVTRGHAAICCCLFCKPLLANLVQHDCHALAVRKVLNHRTYLSILLVCLAVVVKVTTLWLMASTHWKW